MHSCIFNFAPYIGYGSYVTVRTAPQLQQCCSPVQCVGLRTTREDLFPELTIISHPRVRHVTFQAGVTETPVFTRSAVRALTENRTFTNARAQRDLGYVPR